MNTMKSETFRIEGMTCEHCLRSLVQELNQLPIDVKKVEIGSAEVVYDDTKVPRSMIENAIVDAGFAVVRPADV